MLPTNRYLGVFLDTSEDLGNGYFAPYQQVFWGIFGYFYYFWIFLKTLEMDTLLPPDRYLGVFLDILDIFEDFGDGYFAPNQKVFWVFLKYLKYNNDLIMMMTLAMIGDVMMKEQALRGLFEKH